MQKLVERNEKEVKRKFWRLKQKVVLGELYPVLDDRYQRRVDTRLAQIQQRNGLRGYQSGYSGGNLIDVLNNKSIAILNVRLTTILILRLGLEDYNRNILRWSLSPERVYRDLPLPLRNGIAIRWMKGETGKSCWMAMVVVVALSCWATRFKGCWSRTSCLRSRLAPYQATRADCA